MFFVRLLRISLSPFRAATRLRRSVKGRGGVRGNLDQAATQLAAVSTTGAVAMGAQVQDVPDVRHGVFFKIFECPNSDEPTIDPNDVAAAVKMVDRARAFYKLRADLFPPDDVFYEQVEGGLIDRVSRIDNDGDKDQFIATLDQARRLSNDNTRKLLCELAPIALGVMLLAYAGVLLFADASALPQSLVGLISGEAFRLAAGAALLAVALASVAFIYLFSFSHIQRANALNLNAFIATEFAHLNNAFLVAQREALQAETQLADTQKEQLKSLASSWTLAYHWISVRQLFEEMFVRNVMFQIRRNATLYATLGVLICVGAFIGAGVASGVTASVLSAPRAAWVDIAHLALAAIGFVVVTYGLTVRRPFAIIATALLKDQWYRYDTLAVGDAIAEQVTRDKVQIVINRDRARAAGV
jgi:hypothetical protein